MNQILDYNPNKSSGGGSSGSDKVVRVFAVILACFAICLLAGGAYGIYKNKEKTDKPVATQTEAKITVEQGESTATIKVSHNKAIEKLIYSWDSGKENNVKGSGESSIESVIDLLAGKHTLCVKVTDIDGFVTTYQQEITSEKGEDRIYPVIALDVTEDKKLKITATDETAIDFVTYRWNDEDEQRVDVSETDDKKIEFEIDILKGKNDLLIVAVDKNSNNTTESKSFTGVTKPDVTITISPDKKSAEVKCSHENGLKEIKLKINETDYEVDIGTDNPKDITFPVELAEGNSTIIVTATSIDDTVTEAKEEVTQEPEVTDEVTDEGINITIEQSQDNAEIGLVTINAPDGIKEVKLNINDVDYEVAIGDDKPVDVNFEIPLVEGNNRITLKVINTKDAEKEEIKEITR